MGPRTRTVRKLSGLDIDEVSLVDRPANQHGLVAFAKRDEENPMDPIFDADNNEVDPTALEHGDVVYAEDGTELVFVADGETDPDLGEIDDGQYGGYDNGGFADGSVGYEADAEQFDAAGVGKALRPLSAAKLRGGARLAGNRASTSVRGARNAVTRDRVAGFGTAAGMEARALGNAGRQYGGMAARQAGATAGRVGRSPAFQVGAAAGGAGAVGGYSGGRRRNVGKSLGEEVRVALSKALTEDERDGVISKAMDLLGDVVEKNHRLEATLEQLVEDRELEAYGEVAKGYEGLPVDPEEFGGILHRVAGVLEPTQLATLDRVFKAVGAGADFDELGYGGPGSPAGANEVLEQVYALAGQAVGKAADGITAEQAVTAIFEANPAAYDEYEAEQRSQR